MGASVAVVHPTWKLIFGSYQVPTQRNGIILDSEVYRARGDNAELTLRREGMARSSVFLPIETRGAWAITGMPWAFGPATATVPNTVDVEKPGHVKYGFGINIEQPLANDGETGLFARAGWANGTNSAWSYTEVDSHASLGLQVSGRNWGRPEDYFGLGVAVNGDHGFPSALPRPRRHRHAYRRRGSELRGWRRYSRAYYRIQLGRFVQLSPDYQYIQNPGYNRDRGPIQVYSLRLRLSY